MNKTGWDLKIKEMEDCLKYIRKELDTFMNVESDIRAEGNTEIAEDLKEILRIVTDLL